MIVTFATENYVDYLSMLLSSFGFYNEDKAAIIYCMGWSTDMVKKAQIVYPEYKFIEKSITDSQKKRVSENRRCNKLVRIKPSLVKEVYDNTEEKFLWIDADSLVLKTIDPLLNILDKYDLICTHRSHYPKYARFAVAVLGFGRTDRGKKILDRYASVSKLHQGHKNWYFDQCALNDVVEEFPGLSLHALTGSEHNIHRNPNCIVLSNRMELGVKGLTNIMRNNNVPIRSIK